MSSDVIEIAFAAEGSYLPHAATMLRSLLTNNPGEAFRFHLLQGPDLDVVGSALLEEWLSREGHALHRLLLPESRTQSFRDSRYFRRAIWYRILLPELLPDCPKLLYLDADLLVNERLRPLWDTDLGAHLLAAVVSPLYPMLPRPEEMLGVPSQRYLNSGVMLMNLAAMRAEAVVETLLAYSRHTPPGIGGTEQDALARLYQSRTLFLHPRWNVQTSFYELPLGKLPMPAGQARSAKRQPAIVHFTDPVKPSHYGCRHPWRDAYLRYRLGTPWPLKTAVGRSLKLALLRRLPFSLLLLRQRLALRNHQNNRQ